MRVVRVMHLAGLHRITYLPTFMLGNKNAGSSAITDAMATNGTANMGRQKKNYLRDVKTLENTFQNVTHMFLYLFWAVCVFWSVFTASPFYFI